MGIELGLDEDDRDEEAKIDRVFHANATENNGVKHFSSREIVTMFEELGKTVNILTVNKQ